MTELTELFDKYNSDKGFKRDEGHGYGEIYDSIFRKYIGKHPKILEIGIQKGGCIRAINEFFGGDCDIYGIDIDNKCKEVESDVKTFKFFNFDASNEKDVEYFKQNSCKNVKFDIIIDDGSHICREQLKSLAFLNDLLDKNGVYIIEDLHCCLNTWNIGNKYWCGKSDLTTIDCLMQRAPHAELSKEENSLWVQNLRDVVIMLKYNTKIRGNYSIVAFLKYQN